MYEKPAVERFAAAHIGRWHEKPIRVPCRIIWGFEPIFVDMLEFTPRDSIVANAVIARDDWANQQTSTTTMPSPPLGMSLVDRDNFQEFNQEVDDIVCKWLAHFVPRFYSKNEDDFCRTLLKLLADFSTSLTTQQNSQEQKFLRDVFRLLVVTYLLAHAVTIDPKQQESTLSQMSTYKPGAYPKNALPKLANRQLKHMFSNMRDRLTDRVLKSLSQFLKSSKRHERWTAAFCAILGLAVAMEQTQQMVHVNYGTHVVEGTVSDSEAMRRGEKVVAQVDDRFTFVTKLFRHKYHQKFNPLRDVNKKEMREQLGERAWGFVKKVVDLVVEKGKFFPAA